MNPFIIFYILVSINLIGIKKVSQPKEKPQELRKYAILGALFSIRTQSLRVVCLCSRTVRGSRLIPH